MLLFVRSLRRKFIILFFKSEVSHLFFKNVIGQFFREKVKHFISGRFFGTKVSDLFFGTGILDFECGLSYVGLLCQKCKIKFESFHIYILFEKVSHFLGIF